MSYFSSFVRLICNCLIYKSIILSKIYLINLVKKMINLKVNYIRLFFLDLRTRVVTEIFKITIQVIVQFNIIN